MPTKISVYIGFPASHKQFFEMSVLYQVADNPERSIDALPICSDIGRARSLKRGRTLMSSRPDRGLTIYGAHHPNLSWTLTPTSRTQTDSGYERHPRTLGTLTGRICEYVPSSPVGVPATDEAICSDGAGTERWQDSSLASTYGAILRGDWKNYDPYDITGRLAANTDMYDRPNQVRCPAHQQLHKCSCLFSLD